MANNKKSSATLVETMIEKYGSYEAYKQSMRERAKKGGKNGNKTLNPNYSGGFAGDNVRARIAGGMGGRYSRKGHKLIERTETSGTYRRMSDGAIVEIKY